MNFHRAMSCSWRGFLPSMTTSRDASRLCIVRCTLMRYKLEYYLLIVVQIAILNHLTKIGLEWPDSAKISRREILVKIRILAFFTCVWTFMNFHMNFHMSWKQAETHESYVMKVWFQFIAYERSWWKFMPWKVISETFTKLVGGGTVNLVRGRGP